MSTLFPAFFALLPGWLAAILEASLHATLVAGLVIGIQLAWGRHLPARWRFALWFLVLARLLPLPMPECRVSLFNVVASPGNVQPQAASAPEAAPLALDPVSLTSLASPLSSAAPEKSAPAKTAPIALPPFRTAASPPTRPQTPAPPRTGTRPLSWPTLLVALYAIGAVLLALRYVIATRRLSRLIQTAQTPPDDHLVASLDAARRTLGIRHPLPLVLLDTLSSPALVGFWHPRLLLPAHLVQTLSHQDLRHIFLHECAHLRRRDVLLNYLLAALTVVHWFNPFLHLLLPRFRADRELATDELVLLHVDASLYGQTLLNVFQAGAIPCRAPASVAITETRSFFARRIHMIARFQKRPAWVSIPAALALAVAAVCTLTGPITRAVAPVQGDTATVTGTGGSVPEKRSEAPSTRPIAKAGTLFEGVYQTPTQAVADRANVQTRATLERPVKSLSFNQVPLEKALSFLQDQAPVSYHINWAALEAAGVDKNVPVSARATDIPLRRGLLMVLRNASAQLGYTVEDGMVLVSTQEELHSAAHLSSRVYNIRPLIAPDSDFATQIDQITDLIKSNVAPDSWRDSGGTVGSIKEFNGLLTITSSSDIHYEISELLGTMAQADAGSPAAPARTTSVRTTAQARDRVVNAGATLAAAAMDNATGLMNNMLQQLSTLAQTRMNLEQERAAMIAGGKQAHNPEFAALEARLDTVNKQLEQANAQLKAAEEKIAQRSAKSDAAPVKTRRSTRMFNIRFLLGDAENSTGAITADQRSAMEDLVRTLITFAEPADNVMGFNGTIIVEGSDTTLKKIEEMIQALEDRERQSRAAAQAKQAAK